MLGITVLMSWHSILGRLVEFPLASLMVMISRHDFLSSSRCGYPVANVRVFTLILQTNKYPQHVTISFSIQSRFYFVAFCATAL